MKTKTKPKTYRTVQFVGDYFCLSMTVEASSDDEAQSLAISLMDDHYGWDIEEVSNEITVDDTGDEC